MLAEIHRPQRFAEPQEFNGLSGCNDDGVFRSPELTCRVIDVSTKRALSSNQHVMP